MKTKRKREKRQETRHFKPGEVNRFKVKDDRDDDDSDSEVRNQSESRGKLEINYILVLSTGLFRFLDRKKEATRCPMNLWITSY